MEKLTIVGEIRWEDRYLNVYGSLDEPWFRATDVAKMIDYSNGKTHYMLENVEDFEKMLVPQSMVEFRSLIPGRVIPPGFRGSLNPYTTVDQDECLAVGSTHPQRSGRGGNRNDVWVISETGLYNILSQSRKPIARKWRIVVHAEIVALRKQQLMTVADKFEDWTSQGDDIFWHEEFGKFMKSITVQGGDVAIVDLDWKYGDPVQEDC